MSVKHIAFIGTRGHQGTILRELPQFPHIKLVACSAGGCDDSIDQITKWSAEHSHETEVFSDWREMLERVPTDVLVVSGPFESHAEMSIAAIERGIHVICEKPAAITLSDLDRVRAACDKHPTVHLACMMFSRYDPGFYTAKRLIDQGAIGQVRLINARKSYRLGKRGAFYADRATYGGTIPWVGSHAIDWTIWYGNSKISHLHAIHSTIANGGNGTMERSAAVQFVMEGDIAASISIDVFRPENAPTHGDDWARIVGAEGVIEVRPTSLHLINATNNGSIPVPVACDRTPLRDFLDHVEGRRKAICDKESALALTDICLRARDAADSAT